MTKIYCDICKKLIDADLPGSYTVMQLPTQKDKHSDWQYKNYDVCHECAVELNNAKNECVVSFIENKTWNMKNSLAKTRRV